MIKKIISRALNFGLIILFIIGGIMSCDNNDNADRNPQIDDIQPDSGPYGTSVTISGSDFHPTASQNSVSFAGTSAEISEASESQIQTSVPDGAESGAIEVTVDGNTAPGPNFTVQQEAPGISAINPDSGTVGTEVTISGMNFSPTSGENAVTFNGTDAPVNSTAEDELVTEVPEGATDGPVEVTVNDTTTTGPDFNVINDESDETNNIAAQIENDDELSTLANQISDTDLQSTLEDEGPYTLLAPTNTAFDNLPSGFLDNLDQDQLTDILSYFIISDDIAENDLANTPQAMETLQGDSVYITNDIDINNNSTVISSDIEAANGRIHKIDEVIRPDTFLNVFEITYKRYTTNKFACACVSGRTGLENILRDENSEFTIFAPSNTAFENREVPVDSLSDNDLEVLLNNHIIENQVLSDELDDGDTFTTRNDYEITVSVGDDGTISLNGEATVEENDLEGINGVVYIIDSTLESEAEN